MTQTSLSALITTLAAAADPQRAPAMRAYMRDQFSMLGVATPQRRQLIQPYALALKNSDAAAIFLWAQQLWELPEREYQYAAIDLLAMHWKTIQPSDIPQLLALAQRKSWWDTVDGLASVIAKVLRYQHHGMDQALQHPDLWVRRIALLHQLGWREKVDSVRLFDYALALAHENEFFIQKAIGWSLRDYAHHQPEDVRTFITQQKTRLSALSFREANKHLGA